MMTRRLVSTALLTFLALLLTAGSTVAREAHDPAAIEKLSAATQGSAKVVTHNVTGAARFVRLTPGSLKLAGENEEDRARAFFQQHGGLFGIVDSGNELVTESADRDYLGFRRVNFTQEYRGVPVFGGQLRAHFNAAGQLKAVNGTFVPDIQINTTPYFSLDALTGAALSSVSQQFPATLLTTGSRTLYVYRQGLLRGVQGRDHLVYEIEITGPGVREFVYIDAHTRKPINQITGIHQAIHRSIHDMTFGNIIWDEGDPVPYESTPPDPTRDPDINGLIDYAEDTYDLFMALSGGTFPSWDGMDGVMHSVFDDPTINCPNANWNGTSTNYCTGTAGDDTVAHEWAHAYTDSTHNLIYQWQSGALNESYSDIFGEVVDFINGAGTDSPIPPRTAGECSTFGGSPAPICTINSPPEIAGTQIVSGAEFNPAGPLAVTADVELVDDNDDMGGTTSTTDACEPLVGFTPGNIALMDRGNCNFTVKVVNAQTAGAVGVKMVNDRPGLLNMGGTDPSITIPSVLMLQTVGEEVKTVLEGSTVNATIELGVSTDVSYRWLSGEDDPAFGGAIRDMWTPNCYGDPGKVSDQAQYVCDEGDSGGVHTNSGIPNHAFALLVDGGTYNGVTVDAIGLIKASHLYWRAMSVYQTETTNFIGHDSALTTSCDDLVMAGTDLADLLTGAPSGEIMSAADCDEVANAMAAVEMTTPPDFCNFQPLLSPNTPSGSCSAIFEDDFEEDPSSTWTLSNEGVEPEYDPRDWEWTADVPMGGTGSAFFALDSIDIGDCVPGSDDQSGVMHLDSPEIELTDNAQLRFDHWVATEALWDGGNVKVSVNGGEFVVLAGADFAFNPYNGVLNDPPGNTNPMASEEAFHGSNGGSVSGSWGQSRINLRNYASQGDTVVLRFDLGVDGCNGLVGWYVDNVAVCGTSIFADGFESGDTSMWSVTTP